MGNMNVRIEIELDTTPTNKHREEMYAVAEYLTNDEDSIAILTLPKKSKAIVAEFTINKARQIDIVDRIGKRFRENIDNYCDSSILSFNWHEINLLNDELRCSYHTLFSSHTKSYVSTE